MDLASSLTDLPPELLYRIFQEVPNELACTCRYFYVMYNDYYGELLRREFGTAIEDKVIPVLPSLIQYVKSFEYSRKVLRRIVTRHYNLTEGLTLESQYYRDSLKLIYGLFKNRRAYIEEGDFQVDPTSRLEDGLLVIDRTNLLNYRKQVTLAPGLYNLRCTLILEHPNGLTTTAFKVFDPKSGVSLTFFLPQIINDLVPHNKLVTVNVGTFLILPTPEDSPHADRTFHRDLIVEDTGLYIKSGFTLCYLDVITVDDREEKDLLAFWPENEELKGVKIVNEPLKQLSTAIEQALAGAPVTTQLGDLGDYTKDFYYKLNASGEPIRRVMKWNTIIDARKYEQNHHTDDGTHAETEPLRWKINHLVELTENN